MYNYSEKRTIIILQINQYKTIVMCLKDKLNNSYK